MTSPSPSEPRTPRLYHAAFAPVTAVKLAATSIGTIYAVQTILYIAGALDLVSAVASDLAVIAILLAYARRRGGLAAVGLRRVKPRFLLAGVLVGLSAWYLALRLITWVEPPGNNELLQKIVEETALLPTLGAIGVMPAIAEEMVFRGVLARALATRYPAIIAVLLSTAAFCAFHLLPAQMLGVLPLGLALGILALGADSIVPTMIAHLINNVIGVLLARDELPPRLTFAISGHPNLFLACAIVVLGAGLALGTRERRRE
jgi:membrane protease YdiL (CAAX protease family)